MFKKAIQIPTQKPTKCSNPIFLSSPMTFWTNSETNPISQIQFFMKQFCQFWENWMEKRHMDCPRTKLDSFLDLPLRKIGFVFGSTKKTKSDLILDRFLDAPTKQAIGLVFGLVVGLVFHVIQKGRSVQKKETNITTSSSNWAATGLWVFSDIS